MLPNLDIAEISLEKLAVGSPSQVLNINQNKNPRPHKVTLKSSTHVILHCTPKMVYVLLMQRIKSDLVIDRAIGGRSE